MLRRFAVVVAILISSAMTGTALAQTPVFTPGAPGLGDPYFPTDGNGGYDVPAGDRRILSETFGEYLKRGLRHLRRVAVERTGGDRDRAGARRRRRVDPRPTARSGRCRSATRDRSCSSRPRSTTAAR